MNRYHDLPAPNAFPATALQDLGNTRCPGPRATCDRRAVLSGVGQATLLATLGTSRVAGAETTPAPAGVFRDDADLLARAYTALHPGLMRYNTPAAMAQRFTALHDYLSVSRSLGQAYLALARTTAAVRCGHSYPNFYNQSARLRAALFEHRDRVPFQFRWIDRRMIVTRDLSPGSRLAPGTEIHAIEGFGAADILQTLMPLARADGHNDAKRRRILELGGIDLWEAFDIYLPMALPRIVERGRVRILTEDPAGKRLAVEVDLMTAAERKAAAPLVEDRPRDAVLWRVDRRPGGVAVLTMPTWAVYNGTWDWHGWLDMQLDAIIADATRTLVVDLRGNEGGLDCGNPILARLIDRDLVITGSGRRVRYRALPSDLGTHVDTWDDSFRDWGAAAAGPRADGFYDLSRPGDDAGGRVIIKPAGQRFAGRLIVLVDAANSSATFGFAQIVKDNRLGTLIGEPTGGNRRGINGGAFLFLRLPASGIEVDIPLIGYFPPGPQPDSGILPDIVVAQTRADIARGRDGAIARILA